MIIPGQSSDRRAHRLRWRIESAFPIRGHNIYYKLVRPGREFMYTVYSTISTTNWSDQVGSVCTLCTVQYLLQTGQTRCGSVHCVQHVLQTGQTRWGVYTVYNIYYKLVRPGGKCTLCRTYTTNWSDKVGSVYTLCTVQYLLQTGQTRWGVYTVYSI